LSAVGHETDFTIADFVADVRAPTPSAAAEMLVRPKEDLVAAVNGLKTILFRRLIGKIQLWEERLRGLKRGLSDPRRSLADKAMRVDELAGMLSLHWNNWVNNCQRRLQVLLEALQESDRLNEYSRLKERLMGYENALRWFTIRTLDQHRHSLEGSVRVLNAVNPWGVLQRGYSITRTLPHLQLITDACQVREKDQVQVLLAEGHLVCRVEETHHEPAPDMPAMGPEKIE
jgi:exodeoxyribonuclease VII large subunit